MKVTTYDIIPSYELDEDMVYRLQLTSMVEDDDLRNPLIFQNFAGDHSGNRIRLKTVNFERSTTTTVAMNTFSSVGQRFGYYGELRGLWLDRHPERPIVILPSWDEFTAGAHFKDFSKEKPTPVALCIFNVLGQGYQLYIQPFDLRTVWEAFWDFLVVDPQSP